MKNLYKALADAISAMDDPKKNATNPHFKSKFADLGQVLECIRQPLADNGLLVFQAVGMWESELAGSTPAPVLKTTLAHIESGESLEDSYPLIPDKPGPQALGACITYARRYALKTLFSMVDVDDDGESAHNRTTPKQQANGESRRTSPRTDGPTTLQQAKDALARATTIADVKAVWETFNHCKGDDLKALTVAVNQRKEQLTHLGQPQPSTTTTKP